MDKLQELDNFVFSLFPRNHCFISTIKISKVQREGEDLKM
jgi:hypothetical protein